MQTAGVGTHEPPDASFLPACLGLWIAEDRSKALDVRLNDRNLLVVDIGRGLGRRDIGRMLVTNWHAKKPGHEASRVPGWRLDRLVVEAGRPGLDRTYELLVARPNRDPSAYGGLPWVCAGPSTPREDIRLFPQTGASFLDAVSYQEDEGFIPWAEPLSTYRPATEAEARLHRAR